jgi:hypothetical protein
MLTGSGYERMHLRSANLCQQTQKSYMETWQALIRTYRSFYQKEIRPSSAYIDAIHTCLNFLAFVILGADNSRAGL